MARPSCSRNEPKMWRSSVETWRDGSMTTRVAVLTMPWARAARLSMELAASPIPAAPARFKNRLRGILATKLLLLQNMMSEWNEIKRLITLSIAFLSLTRNGIHALLGRREFVDCCLVVRLSRLKFGSWEFRLIG